MAGNPASFPVAVQEALQRGQPTEAIRLLHGSTGIGLKRASEVIHEHLRSHMMVRAATATPVAGQWASPHPVAPPPTAAGAAGSESRLEALARLRKVAGLGLRSARDDFDVERFSAGPLGAGGRSPGEVPRAGRHLWWIVVLALAGYVGYVVYRDLDRAPGPAHRTATSAPFAVPLAAMSDMRSRQVIAARGRNT